MRYTEKIRNFICQIKGKVSQISLMMFLILIQVTNVYAGINDSVFVSGTKKMAKDGTKAVQAISAVACVLCVSYAALMKMISSKEEMEGKKYDKWIKVAIVCGIVCVAAEPFINMFTGYYS